MICTKKKIYFISIFIILILGLIIFKRPISSWKKALKEKVYFAGRYRVEFIPFPISDSQNFTQISVDLPVKEEAGLSPELVRVETTQFSELLVTKWKLPFLKDSGVSGPFAILSKDRFLFLSRTGDLALVNRLGQKMVLDRIVSLAFRDEIFSENTGGLPLAGVKGMLLMPDRRTLFISYHFQESEKCVGLRISRMFLDTKTLQTSGRQIVFQSRPCMPAKDVVYTQAGGVFAYDRNLRRVYFSVGDFGPFPNAQITTQTYGNIWYFDIAKSKSVRLAIGSRNAQGLDFNDESGQLFESEHGPKGGDEINTVEEGDNLGWPKSSYGINYEYQPTDGHYDGPLGQHDFGKKPIFVYFPSEAISGLKVFPKASSFQNWRNDLIVTSLKTKSVFRIKIDQGRAVYSEPLVNLGERLRSLVISEDGQIFVKADPDYLFEIASTSESQLDTALLGKAISSNCLGCHANTIGTAPKVAGRSERDILKALEDFSSGKRASAVMGPIAKSLDITKRKAVASYLSTYKF